MAVVIVCLVEARETTVEGVAALSRNRPFRCSQRKPPTRRGQNGPRSSPDPFKTTSPAGHRTPTGAVTKHNVSCDRCRGASPCDGRCANRSDCGHDPGSCGTTLPPYRLQVVGVELKYWPSLKQQGFVSALAGAADANATMHDAPRSEINFPKRLMSKSLPCIRVCGHPTRLRRTARSDHCPNLMLDWDSAATRALR
jgi:hypothetical protein